MQTERLAGDDVTASAGTALALVRGVLFKGQDGLRSVRALRCASNGALRYRVEKERNVIIVLERALKSPLKRVNGTFRAKKASRPVVLDDDNIIGYIIPRTLINDNIIGYDGSWRTTKNEAPPEGAVVVLLYFQKSGLYDLLIEGDSCNFDVMAAKPKELKAQAEKTSKPDGASAAPVCLTGRNPFLPELEGEGRLLSEGDVNVVEQHIRQFSTVPKHIAIGKRKRAEPPACALLVRPEVEVEVESSPCNSASPEAHPSSLLVEQQHQPSHLQRQQSAFRTPQQFGMPVEDLQQACFYNPWAFYPCGVPLACARHMPLSTTVVEHVHRESAVYEAWSSCARGPPSQVLESEGEKEQRPEGQEGIEAPAPDSSAGSPLLDVAELFELASDELFNEFSAPTSPEASPAVSTGSSSDASSPSTPDAYVQQAPIAFCPCGVRLPRPRSPLTREQPHRGDYGACYCSFLAVAQAYALFAQASGVLGTPAISDPPGPSLFNVQPSTPIGPPPICAVGQLLPPMPWHGPQRTSSRSNIPDPASAGVYGA